MFLVITDPPGSKAMGQKVSLGWVPRKEQRPYPCHHPVCARMLCLGLRATCMTYKRRGIKEGRQPLALPFGFSWQEGAIGTEEHEWSLQDAPWIPFRKLTLHWLFSSSHIWRLIRGIRYTVLLEDGQFSI